MKKDDISQPKKLRAVKGFISVDKIQKSKRTYSMKYMYRY
jgi:hypothetical protein